MRIMTSSIQILVHDLELNLPCSLYPSGYWETADLVTFTEEAIKGKLHFLCSVSEHKLLKINLNILALQVKRYE